VALSMKELLVEDEIAEEEEEALPTTMELAFRQAMAQQERQSEEKGKGAKGPPSGDEQDDIITRTLRMHREQAER
jgi:hypothetical protein